MSSKLSTESLNKKIETLQRKLDSAFESVIGSSNGNVTKSDSGRPKFEYDSISLMSILFCGFIIVSCMDIRLLQRPFDSVMFRFFFNYFLCTYIVIVNTVSFLLPYAVVKTYIRTQDERLCVCFKGLRLFNLLVIYNSLKAVILYIRLSLLLKKSKAII